MPRRTLPIVLGALVVAVAAAVTIFVLRPTDESRVRDQMTRLAAVVHVKDDDAQGNPIARSARVDRDLALLMQPDVRVTIPDVPSPPSNRAELATLVESAPRFVRSFDVDFTHMTLKWDEAHTTAFVSATAKVDLVERDGATTRDKYAIDVRFARDGSQWLIRTLTVWSKEDATPE